MRIDPSIVSSAIQRYEKAIRKNSVEKAPAGIKDRIDISDDAKIYNNLVRAASSKQSDNSVRVNELQKLSSEGKYVVDPEEIADAMMK